MLTKARSQRSHTSQPGKKIARYAGLELYTTLLCSFFLIRACKSIMHMNYGWGTERLFVLNDDDRRVLMPRCSHRVCVLYAEKDFWEDFKQWSVSYFTHPRGPKLGLTVRQNTKDIYITFLVHMTVNRVKKKKKTI